MQEKKLFPFQEIKQKLVNFCVYQDRCHAEVEQKMKEFVLIPEANITIPLTGVLNMNANNLWITYKLKATAKEGNKVDAALISLTTDNETVTPANGNPAGSRSIMLRRTLIQKLILLYRSQEFLT